MVAVASREIRDGDLVFVGMRLPILAYAVERSTHAPTAGVLFEVGVMRVRAACGYVGLMGAPAAIITTLCVFRFPPEGGEAYLDSIHPGHTLGEVQKETGWAIAGARDVRVTPEPTPAELAEIRRRSA